MRRKGRRKCLIRDKDRLMKREIIWMREDGGERRGDDKEVIIRRGIEDMIFFLIISAGSTSRG